MQMAAAPQPFSLFFKQQAPAVARLLRSSLRPDDADECLQETFMSALRSYDDFDGANPRAWILTIARRKAIDFHRSLARRPEAPAGASLEPPAPAAPAAPLQGEIWREVAALPEKQRSALVLRYELDLAHREIGAVLDCSEAAARRSVHEGIAKLRASRTATSQVSSGSEETSR